MNPPLNQQQAMIKRNQAPVKRKELEESIIKFWSNKK